MAYDRHDPRQGPRDERSRWSGDRPDERSWRERERGLRGGDRDERGFFERAGEQIASWFGDDDDARDRYGDRSVSREQDRSGWFGSDDDRPHRPM